MNLNRIKNNLANRDWSSKSTKTNINYLKSKLKDFGLSVPKYFSKGKISDSQIQYQANRIIKAINTEIVKQPKVDTKQNAYNRALAKYQEEAIKHNEKAVKMTFYAMQKLGKFTSNVQGYLQGRELDLSSTSGITYQRANTPFAIEDYENIEFADAKTINRRINSLKKLNRRLTKKQIEKELVSNQVSKQSFESKLQGYVDAGDITENDKELLMTKFNSLNGLQQEILINNVVKDMPNRYPKASKEEGEEISANLVNKLNREMNTISNYF